MGIGAARVFYSPIDGSYRVETPPNPPLRHGAPVLYPDGPLTRLCSGCAKCLTP